MKFGGTSISDAKRVKHTAQIIESHLKDKSIIVVVSAVKGITDELLAVCEDVRKGKRDEIKKFTDKIRKTHLKIANEAIRKKRIRDNLVKTIVSITDELNAVLNGMILLGEVTPKSTDYILSFGERLVAPILSAALNDLGIKSIHLTGKDAGILTDSNYGEAKPLMDTTRLRLMHTLEPVLKSNTIPVITGFIAADQNGNITTLGRGGSDYTSTILASCLNADEVWLWTDVDGLMTADPKIVKNARVIREVSYAEAMEMALFGAKYMHPRALDPIQDKSIRLRIRNTFKPEDQGTLITKELSTDSKQIVKAVNMIRNLALVDVRGGSMVGAPGTAAKIFDVLGKNKVNITMISQGPSESSISMVVRKNDLDKAVNALELNLLGKLIKSVNVTENVVVIAAVGSGMRGIKGVAARIFGAVAQRGINVIMIAQGSSELDLAFVVEEKDCEEAVRAIHTEFGLGSEQPNI